MGGPAGIRAEIDGHVLQDSRFGAVRLVLDLGIATDGLGIGDAGQIVGDRYAYHRDRIARGPESPLDLESPARKVAGCEGRVPAIEAVRDGDTVHDWFVIRPALTEQPAEERSPGHVHWSVAKRHLGEGVDLGGRPATAVAAGRAGRAPADHLGGPFHFAGPDGPDDEAPRRRP
ncbi:hypothetical protein ACIA8O_03400 [Kitasatospora sp. NPDC051853]|uniref:hypothetical protein n=1 Tax=Kitasatospora sp. NPDC051853 TaxID=3364058 RepID=UPI00379A9E07